MQRGEASFCGPRVVVETLKDVSCTGHSGSTKGHKLLRHHSLAGHLETWLLSHTSLLKLFTDGQYGHPDRIYDHLGEQSLCIPGRALLG